MVQLENDSEVKITLFQSAFAGAAAGAVTRALAQPLDVLKIRFQLQVEPITDKQGSKYSSILQALGSIIREEGVATLWSGHIPAQLLSISYGILQFATFEKLTDMCQSADRQFYTNHKHWINFCNGSIAATVATVASFPFDTVRTRLIAEQKTNKVYNGFLNALSVMIKTEGPVVLFKGLIPTLGQIAPHAGVQFAVYKLFTEHILIHVEKFQRDSPQNAPKSSIWANLIAGSFAGFTAKTVIYPFDVMKKRLQIQGFQQHRKSFGKQMYCNGLLHCIKLIIAEEGYLALYKGYSPSVLKAVFVSALHFSIYDEIKYFLLRINHG